MKLDLPLHFPANTSSGYQDPAYRAGASEFGIPEQIRTANLNLRRVARFQLRHRDMAERMGLEPMKDISP